MNNKKTEKTNNRSLNEKCPSRPSFREAFRRAAQQIDLYECTTESERDLIREICYIIAEVYIMNPDSKVKISDEFLDAYLVQEIFSELALEHVRLVRDNFINRTDLVKNKRAYLRTALYNSIFEFEAHYTNLVNHDLATGGKK